jgi:hypothetical protein
MRLTSSAPYTPVQVPNPQGCNSCKPPSPRFPRRRLSFSTAAVVRGIVVRIWDPLSSRLQDLGFTNVKALYLADNLGTDWAAKGYPFE